MDNEVERSPRHGVIPGFLLLMLARFVGLIPEAALEPLATSASALTVLAMAALGLETDLRGVAKAGGRAIGVVTLSLLVLCSVSFGLLHLLALG